jgi:SAM-dependent methyltransferase
MAERDDVDHHLTAERSQSFGDVATTYERFRPGPPLELIEWMIPLGAATVLDLGAGTGAMTKHLVTNVAMVIAVEPDDRMREVLVTNFPSVRTLKGVGESIPLDEHSVDAVLVSSAWHWMDPTQTLAEVARVLVPGGTLGAVWCGPDPDGPFVAQAQAMLTSARAADEVAAAGVTDLGATVVDSDNRVASELCIPSDSLFAQPERNVMTWDVALTADELIGLLQTFSWIITMPPERRDVVLREARRLLSDVLGIEGERTVDVQYRSEAWRTWLV